MIKTKTKKRKPLTRDERDLILCAMRDLAEALMWPENHIKLDMKRRLVTIDLSTYFETRQTNTRNLAD